MDDWQEQNDKLASCRSYVGEIMNLPLMHSNIPAERSLINSVFYGNGASFLGKMDRSFFVDAAARRFFELAAKNSDKGFFDICTICENDEDRLLSTEIMECSASASAEYYFNKVSECRKIREAAGIIAKTDLTEENAIPEMVEKLLKLNEDSAFHQTYNMRQLANRKVEEWEKNSNKRKIYHLGIPVIDDHVRLRQGQCVYLVAPPKVGKTWLECAIASFLGVRSNVFFASVEMHPEDLFTRIASHISAEDFTELDYSDHPSDQKFKKFSENVNEIISRNISILNARGIAYPELKSHILGAINKNFDVIIVDYLQRIQVSPSEDVRIAHMNMSRELANICAKHDKLFVIACQANDPQDGKHATASSVKETKAPKEDADVVLTLTNTTWWEKNKAKYETGKPYALDIDLLQRRGYCGLFKLWFSPQTGRMIAREENDFEEPEEKINRRSQYVNG